MDLRQKWESAISKGDVEQIKEKILTGYLKGKPFAPDTMPSEMKQIVLANGQMARVLDFGCGLGRNFPGLRPMCTVLEGYDLPGMIEMCQREANTDADYLGSDWSVFRKRKYDMIFAAIVLQHIAKEALEEYLKDMRMMTTFLAVPGRGASDDPQIGVPIWDFIESQGYEKAYERLAPGDHRWCLFCPKC